MVRYLHAVLPLRLAAFSVCFVLPLFSGSVPTRTMKLDAAWKLYASKQQGYCLSYPSRWTRSLIDDTGSLAIQSGARRFALPSGAINDGA